MRSSGLLAVVLVACSAAAEARVVRVEVTRRSDLAGGQAFGAVGAVREGRGPHPLRGLAGRPARPRHRRHRPRAAQRRGRGGVHGRLLRAATEGPGARERLADPRDPEPRRQGDPGHGEPRGAVARPGDRGRARRRLPDEARLHGGLGRLAVGRAGRARADANRRAGRDGAGQADHRPRPRRLHAHAGAQRGAARAPDGRRDRRHGVRGRGAPQPAQRAHRARDAARPRAR